MRDVAHSVVAMTLPRPCLTCGIPTRNGARCPPHARAASRARGTTAERGYDSRWASQSKLLRVRHLELYGPVCPGWAVGPHRVDPRALVVDHDVGVLCRSCNSRKAATVDRERAAARRRATAATAPESSDGASAHDPCPVEIAHTKPPGVA